MGNVRMRAEQINYGASNVKVALDDLDPKDLIALSARMDTIEAWKATVKTEEKTGASVEYINALALAAVSLSAEIEPIQDLHGYDHPWVGGAGKNKAPFDYTSGQESGVHITNNNDGTFSVYTDAGGATANVTFVLHNFVNNGNVVDASLVGKSVILNGCPSGGSESTYFMQFFRYDGTNTARDTGSGTSALSVESVTTGYVNIAIRVVSGTVITTPIVFKPMVRLSSESDASFAPYSNICPISGRDSVVVDDTGLNLFDKSDIVENYRLAADGGFFPETGYYISPAIDVVVGETYTKNSPTADAFHRYCTYDADNNVVRASTNNTITIQAPEKTIRFCGLLTEVNTAQFEVGSASTSYQPYAHSSATIQLGQTVYGGSLNVTTGVLTVTTAILVKNTADMDNSEDYPGWKESGIRALVGGGINRIITGINTNCGTAYGVNTTGGSGDTVLLPKDYYGGKTQTEWIALAVDIQIPVTLATPTTIQLTPAQLTMLKGYNRLSSDGGDITVKAYTGAPWGGDD